MVVCEPALGEALRAQYEGVQPGYHLNKRHWNTVMVDGSLPDEAIRQMIEDAVGHPVDVSTSCGLGRREPDAAMAAMDRIKLLLSDRPPAGLD